MKNFIFGQIRIQTKKKGWMRKFLNHFSGPNMPLTSTFIRFIFKMDRRFWTCTNKSQPDLTCFYCNPNFSYSTDTYPSQVGLYERNTSFFFFFIKEISQVKNHTNKKQLLQGVNMDFNQYFFPTDFMQEAMVILSGLHLIHGPKGWINGIRFAPLEL